GIVPHRFGASSATALRQSSAVARIKWRTVTDAHVKFKGPCRGRDARSAPAPAGWLEDEVCPKTMGICGANWKICMERQATFNGRSRPACVGMEEAAGIFGWPLYYMPFLVRAGHLKPLGKPAQNARKWFATIEIERM